MVYTKKYQKEFKDILVFLKYDKDINRKEQDINLICRGGNCIV